VIMLVLVVDNVLTNRVVSSGWYVPVRLTTCVALVFIARRVLRLTVAEIGLAREHRFRGLMLGGSLFVVIAISMAIAVAIPATRTLFEDRRVDELTTGQLFYEVLIRIPLGTVLTEELAFRGVLYGLFMRHRGHRWAVLVTSGLFGLWHILPAAGLGDVNPAASDTLGEQATWVAVAFGVGATTAAGIVFALMRRWSGSLYASLLVHLATNTSGFIAAWYVLRTYGAV